MPDQSISYNITGYLAQFLFLRPFLPKAFRLFLTFKMCPHLLLQYRMSGRRLQLLNINIQQGKLSQLNDTIPATNANKTPKSWFETSGLIPTQILVEIVWLIFLIKTPLRNSADDTNYHPYKTCSNTFLHLPQTPTTTVVCSPHVLLSFSLVLCCSIYKCSNELIIIFSS